MSENEVRDRLAKMEEDVKRQYDVISCTMRGAQETACAFGAETAFGVAATLWCLQHVGSNQAYFSQSLTLVAALGSAAEEMDHTEEG